MFRDLNTLPKRSEIIFWADYIEFKSLINTDKSFTYSNFSALFSSEENVPKGRDFISSRWRMAVSLCKARANYFEQFYSFEIPSDEDDILLLKQDLNECQKSYLSLLICSSLKYFEKNISFDFSREFEKLSKYIFTHMLPAGSTIKSNWPNPEDGEECYSGNKFEKYRAIAKDIRTKSLETISESDFNPRDRGDGGIDLVGWHGMYDQREAIPIACAQCSCQRTEWKMKQSESTYHTKMSFFPLIHPWSSYYFCPLDLWKSEKEWRFRSDIQDSIPVDRYRILNFMSNSNEYFHISKIQEIIEFEQSIV